MKFSLVIATLGRLGELEALLMSLRRQTHQDFEVIVVDQNPPEFLREVRLRHEDVFQRLVWRQVDFRAANLARNIGLDEARGDVVSFADDDCEYQPDTLATVAELFNRYTDCGVLTGKAVDKPSGDDSMGRWPDRDVTVGVRNVLMLSLEFTTFFTRAALATERLDPGFGPGTRFGSREGPDLMLRLLYRGVGMRYSPRICLFHPHKFTSLTDPAFLRRTRSYELGFGALLAKHLSLARSPRAIAMLTWHVVLHGLLGLAKSLLMLRGAKVRFWGLLLRSRATGFAEYLAASRGREA
jgi:glycosyltransferase involved in cell wall biosynthesis